MASNANMAITEDEIRAAAQTLKTQNSTGDWPSARAVRSHLGAGDRTRISRVLSELQEQESAMRSARSRDFALPESVMDAVFGAVSRAVDDLTAASRAETRDLRDELARLSAQQRKLEADASSDMEEVESELAAAEVRVLDAERKAGQALAERDAALERARTAEIRLEAYLECMHVLRREPRRTSDNGGDWIADEDSADTGSGPATVA
ncbi:DNA-binding protein [Aliishimia ponticola]|nr:DNA-binding protein [Aliishimia ponticola]